MIRKQTTTDPVIDEIHQIRRKISERFGGDLHAILDDARQRQSASGRPVWSPQSTNPSMQQHGGGDFSDDAESTSSGR